MSEPLIKFISEPNTGTIYCNIGHKSVSDINKVLVESMSNKEHDNYDIIYPVAVLVTGEDDKHSMYLNRQLSNPNNIQDFELINEQPFQNNVNALIHNIYTYEDEFKMLFGDISAEQLAPIMKYTYELAVVDTLNQISHNINTESYKFINNKFNRRE